MAFLAGILQVFVFLLLLKISHIAYWNVRKMYYIHPWLVELALAVVLVLVFHFVSSVWALVIVTAVALGLARGDLESTADDRSTKARQLL